METTSGENKKIKSFVTICEFSNYMAEVNKFREQHPDVKIIEEIKSLYMQQVKVPQLGVIKQFDRMPETQMALMIICAIIFEEPTPTNI